MRISGQDVACLMPTKDTPLRPERRMATFIRVWAFWPGGELDLPECVSEDRWLQLSSVERTIYNRTFNALETSVRQSGLLRQKNRNNMEAAARRFKT